MKDIFTIIFRLTLSCILAGTVMGTTFILTNKAKKHNEHVKEEKVAFSLLGFEGEAPESVKMDTLFRYVVSRAGEQLIGYLMPVNDGFTFLQLDLDGNLASSEKVDLSKASASQAGDREIAILAAIGPGSTIRFAEEFKIIREDGQRAAYLISGKFPGFKTHIAVMLALNTDFSIIGFEVLEHEEDPGLGAEIEQPYFKNQFKDKPFDVVKNLDVVKAPIPDEYLDALEVDVAPEDVQKMMEKYRGNDIYALTGATISAVAVTDGLKGMIKKFAYRIDILDSVMDKQSIAGTF
jgi:electron transport complex protein RnfG